MWSSSLSLPYDLCSGAAARMCVFVDPEIKSVSGLSVFQWLLHCDITGRENFFAVPLHNYNKYKVDNEFCWWSEKFWKMPMAFAPKSSESICSPCGFSFLFSTACFWEMDSAKYGSVLIAATQKHLFVCSGIIFLTRFLLCKRRANAVQFGYRAHLVKSWIKTEIVFLLYWVFSYMFMLSQANCPSSLGPRSCLER